MTILKTHVLFSGFSFKFNACREGHYSPSATPCAPSNPPEQCLRAVGGTWRVPTTTVDRCFSFSEGVFPGSMLVFEGCKPFQIKIKDDCDQRSLNPANQVILQPSPTLFKGSTQFQGGTRNHSTPRLQLPSLEFSSCTPCNAAFLRYEELDQAAFDLCVDISARWCTSSKTTVSPYLKSFRTTGCWSSRQQLKQFMPDFWEHFRFEEGTT